jgi:hypothetical protein
LKDKQYQKLHNLLTNKDRLTGIKEKENKLYSLIFEEMENKVTLYKKEEQAQMKQ